MNSKLDGIEDTQNEDKLAANEYSHIENHKLNTLLLSMKGEITELTETCESVKLSSTNMKSQLDSIQIKQKCREVLLKNQHWEYSALHYWDGDENVEVEAEDLICKIMDKTKEMRYNNGGGDISINRRMVYHNELLPHWKEFASALEQYQYHLSKETEATLHLNGMELPDTIVDLLSTALKSTYFKKFHLERNNLGQKGIDFALSYLKSNPILKRFAVWHNQINDMADINKLCEIVQSHPSIEILELPGTKGTDVNGYKILEMIMNAGRSNLDSIDLSNNNISTGGGTYISDFLTTNPILGSLFLDGNNLNDRDALVIAKALKYNTNLGFLDLTGNNGITKRGWLALRKAEFDDTSLNDIADCNHTCNIRYPSGNDAIEGVDTREMNGDRYCLVAYGPAKCVKQKKIYSVLSSRNRDCSNVKHFEDVPVELLPDLLDSIQQYSNYHLDTAAPPEDDSDIKPLSVVYEICRHWQEVSVYEVVNSRGKSYEELRLEYYGLVGGDTS